MRDYETMYILRPDLEEEAVEAAITRFQELIAEEGALLQMLTNGVGAVSLMRLKVMEKVST